MFSFFKKVGKLFFSIFKGKKIQTINKCVKAVKTTKTFFVTREEIQKSKDIDILRELSLMFLKEFSYFKYFSLALNFAKFLK